MRKRKNKKCFPEIRANIQLTTLKSRLDMVYKTINGIYKKFRQVVKDLTRIYGDWIVNQYWIEIAEYRNFYHQTQDAKRILEHYKNTGVLLSNFITEYNVEEYKNTIFDNVQISFFLSKELAKLRKLASKENGNQYDLFFRYYAILRTERNKLKEKATIMQNDIKKIRLQDVV